MARDKLTPGWMPCLMRQVKREAESLRDGLSSCVGKHLSNPEDLLLIHEMSRQPV